MNQTDNFEAILNKLTSFDLNEIIRESKNKAIEIIHGLQFKNMKEIGICILHLIRKISQNEMISSTNKNNIEIVLKIKEVLVIIKNNFADVFHMYVGKMENNHQTFLPNEITLSIMARTVQIYQMLIFFKDLKIKEFFFRDKSDDEVVQYCKGLLISTTEKLKNFLNSGIQDEDKNNLLREIENNYLQSLYDTTLIKLFKSGDLKSINKKFSSNKLNFFLNDCDLHFSDDEDSLNKPSDSLISNGVRKNKKNTKYF